MADTCDHWYTRTDVRCLVPPAEHTFDVQGSDASRVHAAVGQRWTERSPYDDVRPVERKPRYWISSFVGGRTVGKFMAPISDPLVRHRIRVGPIDLLRGLRHGGLIVEVQVGADSDTATRLLELDPDYLGPEGSASRTAWNADLYDALEKM